jgi:hypothetical protein
VAAELEDGLKIRERDGWRIMDDGGWTNDRRLRTKDEG